MALGRERLVFAALFGFRQRGIVLVDDIDSGYRVHGFGRFPRIPRNRFARRIAGSGFTRLGAREAATESFRHCHIHLHGVDLVHWRICVDVVHHVAFDRRGGSAKVGSADRNPAGRGENPEGFERDFEPPGAEEVEELEEPTLADTIEAVTDAVSSVAASLTTADTAAVASTSGTGAGDSRPPGPPGEGEDIIPRFERWQLNYTASNKNAYAKQLDAFDIELGAFGGGAKGIDTASNLSSSPRKKHNPDPPSEKRLYFSWKTSTPLIQYDRQLLQQAGIGLSGRNIVRFIPPDTENLLANIEKTYCEGKGFVFPNQIAKTIFECKSEGAGYTWEVIEQRYRKGK